MSSAMAQPPPKDPNNYVPGLGDLMGSLQVQHGKLWFAGEQHNWLLAAYAVDAIKEGIADMIVLRPRYKRESIVEMLTLFTAKPLEDLEAAVEEDEYSGKAVLPGHNLDGNGNPIVDGKDPTKLRH